VEGNDEHPPSALGHSEELSVENPVGPPVPEFDQATEERPKVAAAITGEESRYILEEDGGRSVALHKVKEGKGEAAAGGVGVPPPVITIGIVFALKAKACPLAGDGEILARESARPEGGVTIRMPRSVVLAPSVADTAGERLTSVAARSAP
jgi:hypothetical protein